MKLTFKPKKAALALAVLAATLGSSVQAADLSFTSATYGSGPFDQYADSYTYLPDGRTGTMGMWQVSATNPTDSFLAFCIEPHATLPAPGTGVSSAAYTSASYSNANVQELYDRYYADVSTGSAAVSKVLGFQLALWNLQNGTPTGDWRLMLTGDAAKTEADTMLTTVLAAGTVAQKYTLTEWKNEGATNYQDVLQAAPVPEPETYALMFAGLAMVATVARRRNRKAD